MLSSEERVYSERLEQAIDFKTKRAKRLARIKDLVETPGWVAMREDLEDSAKTQEAMNTQDANAPVAPGFDADAFAIETKCRARAASAYRGIIANVEYADAKIRSLNEEIAVHKNHLSELTNKSATKPTQRRVIA